MRAFVVSRAGVGSVEDVEPPQSGAGQVIVDVALVGLCGTDSSLFSGDEEHLSGSLMSFPLRLGHEWSGTVSAVGDGVDDSWIGLRVTGDTMLGCGHCERCRDGRHYLCADRYEIGVRRNWPGALAEKLLVPASALHALPDSVTDEMGAMVEPGGNAYRAVAASGVTVGSRLLVLGPGTIGLLAAQFALAAGSEVHVLGPTEESLEFPRTLGLHGAWTREELPGLAWNAIIDATGAPSMPQFAVNNVEPGRPVVFIGISPRPSLVDSRIAVYKDVTMVGILGGSLGLDPAISAYASGAVDPRPLIAATVRLDDAGQVLSGQTSRPVGAGPKFLVDPGL